MQSALSFLFFFLVTSLTVSPSCFIKSFCQAGNPALLHYSYSAMETGEIGSPDHHFDDMQRGGKDSTFTSAVTLAFPAVVIIKQNTGIINETVRVCGGAVPCRRPDLGG